MLKKWLNMCHLFRTTLQCNILPHSHHRCLHILILVCSPGRGRGHRARSLIKWMKDRKKERRAQFCSVISFLLTSGEAVRSNAPSIFSRRQWEHMIIVKSKPQVVWSVITTPCIKHSRWNLTTRFDHLRACFGTGSVFCILLHAVEFIRDTSIWHMSPVARSCCNIAAASSIWTQFSFKNPRICTVSIKYTQYSL